MNSTKKRQQSAIAATLHELSVKLACAKSFNESGNTNEALSYIKDIHELSYVGPNDYKPL